MIRTATLLLAFGAASAQAEPFVFQTNWVAQAEHGGYYQALVDGDYAACGLEVEIRPGGPQINGRAQMMAGRIDAFMGGNMLFAFHGLSEGIPFQAVAAHFQKDPQILMTHPGFARNFGDLRDLTLFIGDEGYLGYYQWLIAEYGFTPEQRRIYTYNSAPFLANLLSAQQGYVTSEPYMIETQAGFAPDVWLLADYGFDSYSTMVEVMTDTIETRPDAVQCFIDASALGWVKFLHGDNAAALAAIRADNPDMTPELLDYAVAKLKEYGVVDSGEARTLGVGAMTDARMRSFYDRMVRADVLPADLPIEDAYTLRFVNKGVGVALRAELTGQ